MVEEDKTGWGQMMLIDGLGTGGLDQSLKSLPDKESLFGVPRA